MEEIKKESAREEAGEPTELQAAEEIVAQTSEQASGEVQLKVDQLATDVTQVEHLTEGEEEDELTGIEESTEQEIVQKVTKKEPRRKRKKRADRFEEGKSKGEGPEWIEKVVQIRRVTKVVKGGKKLSFRAVVIVGNASGQVGVGVGKALEVISAIQKSVASAKKNLVTIPIINSTIPHEIVGRAGAAKVLLKPAREGTGIIAGGAARTVLELGGVGDVLSKSLGARSPLNVAMATINGLQRLRKFDEVAKLRGITLKEMLGIT